VDELELSSSFKLNARSPVARRRFANGPNGPNSKNANANTLETTAPIAEAGEQSFDLKCDLTVDKLPQPHVFDEALSE
jgi:hypothetical protein